MLVLALSVTLALVILLFAVSLRFREREERWRLADALSMTDPLTGVRNRRYFMQTIAADAAGALRRQIGAAWPADARDDRDLTFFVIDLDRFKLVNDLWGHAAGDAVLAEAASALRRVCRESDVLVRWGGDEFVVVARFTDRREAFITAERLRAAVAAVEAPLPGTEVQRVTCSIGYASYPFDARMGDVLPWTEVLELADFAMLAAKREGGNRCGGLGAGAVPLESPRQPWTMAEVNRCLADGRLERDVFVPVLGDVAADAKHTASRRTPRGGVRAVAGTTWPQEKSVGLHLTVE